MNNEQLMKLDGLVYLREITSGKFENVSKFVEYITTDENGVDAINNGAMQC